MMFRQNGTTDLPSEMLVTIFSYLTLEDLSTATLVCRTFRDLSNTQDLWKEIFKNMAPDLYYKSLLKQNNVDYKNKCKKQTLLIKHALVQFNFPHLYKAITIEKITDWDTIDRMNRDKKSAIEDLLRYIDLNRDSIRYGSRFFSFGGQYSSITTFAEAANAMKEVIFGISDEKCIEVFFDILEYGDKYPRTGKCYLTNIYEKLISVGLISNNNETRPEHLSLKNTSPF